MIRHTLTLLEEHYLQMKATLFRDESEYACLALCGRSHHVDPWTGETEERLLIREVIEVDETAFTERSPTGLTWSTTPFYNALKRAEPKDFAVCVIHSHPLGPLAFSEKDDIAEKELFRIAFDRLESNRPHISMIMDGEGRLVARAYGPTLKPAPVELIRKFGTKWEFYHSSGSSKPSKAFDRQVRAFGVGSTQDLSSLRIGVAGAGGTGSAVCSLLARIGVQRIAIFDNDTIDETNLNRLHFSTQIDANLQRKKVDVVGEGIAKIGLPMSVVRLPYPVDDERCRDALRSCDLIFGCTDDHLGRNLLNRIAHFYLIPVIDLGLLIELNRDEGYDTFDGRVTTIQPGSPCQICRGLIRPAEMLAEGLRRHDPDLYNHRQRAGYINNELVPNPVVITFTTELATIAVNELFQRLNEFRGRNGYCAERVRRFDEVKDADRIPGGKSKDGCPLCNKRRYDGRGDMTPFLDMVT